ncbi:helix-turn-helix domain-containing protein [Lachnospiraceae bacterium ZAX-1]
MDLKKLLKENGMTQAQAAQQLGIPLRTIENWVGGKTRPPKYVLDYVFSEIGIEEYGTEEVVFDGGKFSIYGVPVLGIDRIIERLEKENPKNGDRFTVLVRKRDGRAVGILDTQDGQEI